jgi:hypothetical protein
VYYYISGTLNGLHGTIGTVNGFARNDLNGERNAERFARNGSNRERNAERFARNDSNGEQLERFERFGLGFKICFSETLAIYLHYYHLFIYLQTLRNFFVE